MTTVILNDSTSNNIVETNMNINILQRLYYPELTAPLQDGTLIYIIEDSTNKYVYYNGLNFQLTSDKSIATGFRVLNQFFVYKNYLGGVGLQTYSGLNSNQNYMRHSGLLCWSDTFVGGNFDFSWRFDKVGFNKYQIFNWYPENGVQFFYLSIVSGFLKIQESPIITWRIEKYWDV